MQRKKREGWLQHWPLSYNQARCIHPPFVECYAGQAFLSHLFLTLSWCLKNNIKSQWEKFTSSYNSFFRVLQITILVTVRIARNTTLFSPWNGVDSCPWRNQRRAAGAVWVWCEPTAPRRDPRTGKPAWRKRAQTFLPSHCRNECN